MNMKIVPVPKTLQSPGCEDHLSGHWDPLEVISKPMWIRKGLDNQIHVCHFNPRKGKDLFTPQTKRDFTSHTGKNSLLREEGRWPRHMNPACSSVLEMEGAWCLRWAEVTEASGEGAWVERSEMEWEGGRAEPGGSCPRGLTLSKDQGARL